MNCGVFAQCFPQSAHSPVGADTHERRTFRFNAFDSHAKLAEETVRLQLQSPIVTYGMTFRRAPSHPPPAYWCLVDKVEAGSEAEKARIASGAALVELGLQSLRNVQYNDVLARLKVFQAEPAGELVLVFTQTTLSPKASAYPVSGPRWPEPGVSAFIQQPAQMPMRMGSEEESSSSRPRTNSTMTQFWMSDQHAKCCVACDELFTFCRRRHHCRSCGQIFCSNCCHRLPLSFKPRDVSMNWLRNQLVCHPCHRQLKEGLLRHDPPVKSTSLPLPPPTTAKMHRLASLQPPAQSPPLGPVEPLPLPSSLPEEHNQFLQDINPMLYAMFPKAHMRVPAPAAAASFHLKSVSPSPVVKKPSLRRSDSEPDLLKRVRFAVEDTHTEARRRLPSRSSTEYVDAPLMLDENFQLSKACANSLDLPDIIAAHKRNKSQMAEDASTFVLDRLIATMEKKNFTQLSLADQCAFIEVLQQLSTQAAISVEDGVAGCRIKCFPGGSPTDSFLVSGVLLRKRVARKTMRKLIDAPRILVVASALDYHKEKESFSPLELVAGLETEYMRIAAEKIKRLNPDVVVFQKHVHRVAEECLAAEGIVVVKNIKEEDLRRIAKVTKAAILTAFDHVDKMESHVILGTCKRFRVWTPDPPEPTTDQTKLSKRQCIVFETTDPSFGVTVCLRGAKSKAVLMDLRDIVLQSIHLAYHLRLQRALWSAWGISPLSKLASASSASPFDSMYLALRENSLSMRASIKLQQMKCLSCKTVERKTRAYRRRSSESLSLVQSTQPCTCPRDVTTPLWPFRLVVSVCWSRLDMQTPSVSEWNVLQFYNVDSDCSLGQFLNKYCFDTAPTVYKNAFKTHRLTFTHDMARVHFRVVAKPAQAAKKKGAGEMLMDMVNFARVAIQSTTSPITWIAHASANAPVYTDMTPEMLSYSFGKFLEDLIYMRPLPLDSIYPDLQDVTADRCVRYFAFCDVVVAVSTERIEPVLHVALRPTLWETSTISPGSPTVEELLSLADEIKVLTLQKIDDCLADLSMLQQQLHLTKVPKSMDELLQLRSHARFWHAGFTEKLRQNPPSDLFARHALFREIYDHAAHSCMQIRDSTSTQSTFKVETSTVDQASSNALPLNWFQSLPKHQQPSPTAMLQELQAPKKRMSIDTVATAADFVHKIQTGEIPREEGGLNILSMGIAFPDVSIDAASEPNSFTTGSANLSHSESWNRTWVVGTDVPRSKTSASHFLELPQSLLIWHPSLPKGDDQVVVLVHANQPTSVVAYSLCSVEYKSQLTTWFNQDNRKLELEDDSSRRDLLAVLRSDRRSNIDHLFVDDNEFQSATKFGCKSFYATQFHALRQLSDYDERRYVESLCCCETWEVSGGKSGAGFMKSKDERFISKVIPSNQLQMFLNLAPKYFEYLANSIEANTPTMLSRIVGVYRITIGESNMSVLVMENLVYGRQVDVLFDLKGKMEGRTAEEHGGAVLWDRNFVKMFKGIPMPLQESAMVLLKTAMINDTSFLASVDVVDYSMLVGYDRQKQEVVACIIDYIVKYDLMKRLEHHGKRLLQDEGEITVLNPKQYTKRFQTAMTKYFTPIPSRYSSIVPRHDEDESRV